ncbi:MAG TPA: MipA/OmpV family protein [Paucimonas sp.]|nr:MipA/OmpV family protein [Paucimonas sp.]HJW54901.1 MipA/OmpV family protein [Burkholderiaceae bacterium]
MATQFTQARIIASFTFCISGLLPASASHAKPLPLWEIGAGLAAVNLPDYRGSDEADTYLLPIPYVVYRGEFIKADRNGVRSTLFENDRLEASLSINGTPPVKSRSNTARRGMADLKPTFEVGPTLNVHLWRSPSEKMALDFRAPVRTSITAQSSPKQIGWLFSPNLNLDLRDVGRAPGWNMGLVAGALFSNRAYNAHFYSVAPSEATATRPAYSASGGYAGAQITLTISRRFPHYWIGGFVRGDTVAGAVFDDSPLVRKRGAVSAGVALIRIFSESSTMVDFPE